MRRPRLDLLPRGDVPEMNAPVCAGSGQRPSVRRKGEAEGPAGMALNAAHLLARADVPESDPAVAVIARRGQGAAVGGEDQTRGSVPSDVDLARPFPGRK